MVDYLELCQHWRFVYSREQRILKGVVGFSRESFVSGERKLVWMLVDGCGCFFVSLVACDSKQGRQVLDCLGASLQ
jgi:hypothetical protein